MKKIGFVGLGAMGLPMARNLFRRGHAVTGFDLRPEPCQALAEAGGSTASSAAEAARDAGVLMLMVVNSAQAEAVLFEGGALEALPPNAIVVLTATCAPEAVRGRDCKAALPMASVAHQMFLASSGRGDGARDDSQVIRCYDLLNGRPT